MKQAEKFCLTGIVGSGKSPDQIRNKLDDICVDSELLADGDCDWKLRDGSVVRENKEGLFFSIPENCFGGIARQG